VRVARRGRRSFRTTGRLVLPTGVTASQACGSGVVAVQVKAGRRTISTRRSKVAADCSFATSVTFRHRRGRLKFTARFYGNRALLSAIAKPRFARAR
jgi:hypothetical protein